METNRKPSEIVHHIFIIFCLVGMITHISVITYEYFKYIATSNVEMGTVDKIPIPALSVCWRYLDLIDHDQLNQKLRRKLSPPDYSTLQSRRRSFFAIEKNIMVSDIFELTPNKEQLFIDSIVRYQDQYDVHLLDQSATNENFQVLKTYTQEYICYRVGLKKSGFYDYHRVMTTLNYPGMAFEIGFNISLFGKVKTLLPIVHLGSDLPHYSRLFSPRLKRYEESPPNRIYLTSQRINLRKLRAPYPTDCVDYGNLDLPDRFARCLVKYTINKFGKLPFSEILHEKFDYSLRFSTIVPDENFEKSNQSLELNLAEDNCRRELRKPECYTYMYLTGLVDESTETGSIRFRVVFPNQPEISISFQPMTHFFDFVTYVLSCFGTWIGLSIIDLNPIEIFASRSLLGRRGRNRRLSVNLNRNQLLGPGHSWNQPLRKARISSEQSTTGIIRIAKLESEMATVKRKLVSYF